MAIIVIAPPEDLPVSLAEAKAHMNITTSTDDALIGALISTATSQAQELTSRQLVSATLELVLDGFNDDSIEIPTGPLTQVTSISYIDADGVQQTLAADKYSVDAASLVPRIRPSYGHVWPTTRDTMNAVRVRMVCGWDVDSVPVPVKTWIKVRVATLYEQREATVVGSGVSVAEMPRSFVDGLLDPYVIPVVV